MRFIKPTLSALLLAHLFCALPAHAEQMLWPTDLTSRGDCVSDSLSAPMNAMQTQVDKRHCTIGNAGDKAAIQQCIENSATKTEVVFFTDKCGSEGDDIAFLSLNGDEFRLTRTTPPKSDFPFAGQYVGEGIQVTIDTGTPLPTEDDGSGLLTLHRKVRVTILIGKTTQQIDALFTGTAAK